MVDVRDPSLDIFKALHKVWHQAVLIKLETYGNLRETIFIIIIKG